MRPTYLTINTSLVRENLRKIKDSLPEWSTSTAVIKANGYGHGLSLIHILILYFLHQAEPIQTLTK